MSKFEDETRTAIYNAVSQYITHCTVQLWHYRVADFSNDEKEKRAAMISDILEAFETDMTSYIKHQKAALIGHLNLNPTDSGRFL